MASTNGFSKKLAEFSVGIALDQFPARVVITMLVSGWFGLHF
jgi:hypothetical protein